MKQTYHAVQLPLTSRTHTEATLTDLHINVQYNVFVKTAQSRMSAPVYVHIGESCVCHTESRMSVPVYVLIGEFLTPAPKAGVIVVACAVRASAVAAAAGINLVSVPQTKPMQ